jgi:16S rRNA (cytosine1402-N4)-methyltransferase
LVYYSSDPEKYDGSMHRPVLYHQIIHALRPSPAGHYVDCTLGAAGHAWGILEASSPDGLLLRLDLDPQALEIARTRLEPFGDRAILRQSTYTALLEQLRSLGWGAVNGVLLDLGVSSMQLDTPERGFSFQADAPLDMRFDPQARLRASDLVNDLPEGELAQLLFRYGEEEQARQIAHAIVRARPVHTTGELAAILSNLSAGKQSAKGRQKKGSGRSIHPATRTFQALRIAVNRELEALESVLPQAVAALAPGGRLAVISFHSLEDRIVKQFLRRESRDCLCPPRQPVCTCGHKAVLIELTRRPVMPDPDEISQNPRSRSARLRVAERVSNLTDLPAGD